MVERKAELGEMLKIDAKRERVEAIKKDMTEPDFWLDHEKAGKAAQELKVLEEMILEFDMAETERELEKLEKELMFAGVHDDSSCYLSVHAGSGGTEAMDWAGMLLRMYQRYGEKHSYNLTLLEQSDGEEAGIKSATLFIKGFRAYGNLKGEAGVHRLVRISPFDADKSRHTSFALVEIVPEMDKTTVEIKPEDLKIDVYRSGGHGGQGVNTTDSAVRITHLPTKIVITCQNERSQLQNKLLAMKILEAKLQVIEEENQKALEQKERGENIQASWGNQIRSYVLQPYQLVKDLRTGYETVAVNDVLDGDLDALTESYGKWQVNNIK